MSARNLPWLGTESPQTSERIQYPAMEAKEEAFFHWREEKADFDQAELSSQHKFDKVFSESLLFFQLE